MRVTLNTEMILGLLRAWCKRKLCSEGFEISSFTWEEGKLIIELKESEDGEE